MNNYDSLEVECQGRRPGWRPLFFGWAVLMVAGLLGIPLVGEAVGEFGQGPILIRPWMWIFNQFFSAVHFAGLAALVWGAWSVRDLWGQNRIGAAGFGAMLFWGAALVAVAAMLLFPLVLEPGPWPPDAFEVRLIRVLIFAPGVLRGVGLGLMVLALGGVATASTGRLRISLLVLIGLDLALSIWKWAATPKAVFARLHAGADEPLWLVPWMLAGLLFLWFLKRLIPEKR